MARGVISANEKQIEGLKTALRVCEEMRELYLGERDTAEKETQAHAALLSSEKRRAFHAGYGAGCSDTNAAVMQDRAIMGASWHLERFLDKPFDKTG